MMLSPLQPTLQNVMATAALWTVPSCPVPEHVRSFIIANYGISPGATMYINLNEPNKVYIIHNGYLQYVDFSSPLSSARSVINKLFKSSLIHHSGFECSEFLVQPNATNPVPYSNSFIELPFLKPRSKSIEPIVTTQPFLKNDPFYGYQMQLEKQVQVMKHPEEHDSPQALQKQSQILSFHWDKPTDSKQGIVEKEHKTDTYKTTLCHSFRNTGRCKYGTECCFAHGKSELRTPSQTHPKYKTQLCNKYSANGHCPYGSRCQFIHQQPSNTPVFKLHQKDDKMVLANLTASSPLKSNDVNSLTTLKMNKLGADKTTRLLTDTDKHAVNPKKKSNFLVALPGKGTATNSVSWDAICKKNVQILTHDLPQAHSTPLSLRNTQKTTMGITPSKKKTDISNMLEKLFVNETDASFSQSCFPRLSTNSGWLPGIKKLK